MMTERCSFFSVFVLLCRLFIGSAFPIHVSQGFSIQRLQFLRSIIDRETTPQRLLVLLASSRRRDDEAHHTGRSDFPRQRRRIHKEQTGRRRGDRYSDYDYEDHDDNNDGSSSTYLATCIPGISAALARELEDLGCRNVQPAGPSAVRFTASTATALSTLLWARTPHKIMELLFATSDDELLVQNRDDLYQCIRENVPVKDLLGDGRGGLLSMAVSVMLNNQQKIPQDINHSHFSALTIKNALCDAVRDLRGDGERPNVNLEDPDVPLVAVLRGTNPTRNRDGSMGNRGGAQLSLYRQLHNGSLHRRGYRAEGTAIHKAAMKESLAAGLLREAGWDKLCIQQRQQAQDHLGVKNEKKQRLVLVDPMAGSGTLLLEGALIAADLAPHLMRIKCGLTPGSKSQTYPPVVRWRNIDDENAMNEWKRLLQDATVRAKKGMAWLQEASASSDMELMANDWHPGALDLLEAALDQAGLNNDIVTVSQLDCQDFRPFSSEDDNTGSGIEPDVKFMVVTNPPWGARLSGKASSDGEDDSVDSDGEEDETLHDSWESLRFFLRETCPKGKTEAWVLSGNKKSTKHLGLRRSKSIPIKVGQHDLRWIQYEILDEETKMAIMAAKNKQASRPPSRLEDVQEEGLDSLERAKDSNARENGQSWQGEREMAADRETATIRVKKPKRRVDRSREKAVSEQNEWLLD